MITIKGTIIIPHDEPNADEVIKILDETPEWFKNEDTVAMYYERTIKLTLENEGKYS